MYYYKVFGFIFRCQYPIRQLYEVPKTDDFDADILIGEMPDEIIREVEKETIFPCIFWDDNRFWMNNPYGILAVYKSGLIYAKSPSQDDVFYLLQYVLGYGIAMFAHLHNRIAIHSGCVAIDGKCILISGDSGVGKSTLTHSLIASGARMLSDDVIAIGYDENHNPLVYPAFPQQKLCRDAVLKSGYRPDDLLYVDPEKDKFAVLHRENFYPQPLPLHSAFYLKCYRPDNLKTSQSAKDLRIEKTEGFQKVAFLVNNLYLSCIIPHTGFSAQAFQLCTDTIKDCSVYKIERPEGKDTLNEITAFIHNTLNC